MRISWSVTLMRRMTSFNRSAPAERCQTNQFGATCRIRLRGCFWAGLKWSMQRTDCGSWRSDGSGGRTRFQNRKHPSMVQSGMVSARSESTFAIACALRTAAAWVPERAIYWHLTMRRSRKGREVQWYSGIPACGVSWASVTRRERSTRFEI